MPVLTLNPISLAAVMKESTCTLYSHKVQFGNA